MLFAPTGAALAQTSDALQVHGSVTGALERGSEITIRTTASHPDGWQSLSRLGIELDLHGVVLEDLGYDIGGQTLRAGGGTVLAGTGNTARGQFFRVGGLGLRVTTAGTDLTLSFRAALIEEIPPDARFRFIAEDDDGEEASSALKAAVEDDGGGLGLTTVILAVIGALLAGGFIGGQLTASRKPKSSVYSSLAGRIERERTATEGRT